jgi:hypothetical protein
MAITDGPTTIIIRIAASSVTVATTIVTRSFEGPDAMASSGPRSA